MGIRWAAHGNSGGPDAETRGVIQEAFLVSPFAPRTRQPRRCVTLNVDGWAGKTARRSWPWAAPKPALVEDELEPVRIQAHLQPADHQVDLTGGVAWQSILAHGGAAQLLTADPRSLRDSTPEFAAEARAACPQMEVTRIAGAGHNIRRDAFEAYMAAVSDFLARVTR